MQSVLAITLEVAASVHCMYEGVMGRVGANCRLKCWNHLEVDQMNLMVIGLSLTSNVSREGRFEEERGCTLSRPIKKQERCRELLDVFGHIGGFSFYWAWLPGTLAGRAAGRAL